MEFILLVICLFLMIISLVRNCPALAVKTLDNWKPGTRWTFQSFPGPLSAYPSCSALPSRDATLAQLLIDSGCCLFDACSLLQWMSFDTCVFIAKSVRVFLVVQLPTSDAQLQECLMMLPIQAKYESPDF